MQFQTWQAWDAKDGKWWGTRNTVTVNGVSVSNPCVQSAPCTWNQLLSAFPNVGVHAVFGAVVLKAGSGWSNFRGNVDELKIGVDSVELVFDFELDAPAEVPATAPDSVPQSWLQLSRVNWTPDSLALPLYSELIVLQFRAGTGVEIRSMIVNSVNAEVVGGAASDVAEGFYVLRVSDDSTGMAVRDAVAALDTFSNVGIVSPNHVRREVPTYWRPNDGNARSSADWYLNADGAYGGGELWAASAIRAPHAWGCANGAGVTIAVLDYGLHVNSELTGRVHPRSVTYPAQSGLIGLHGQRVASVVGASANNGAGVAGIAHGSNLVLLDPATYVAGQMTFDSLGIVISDNFTVFQQLQEARIAGARIINISLSEDLTSAPDAKTRDAYRRFVGHAKNALTDYEQQAAPLIVLSAGNAGPSSHPEWNSWAQFADTLPASTIIVAAASRQKGIAHSAATGSGKIDIWAPGEDVATFDSPSGNTLQTGASYAAPLVAGTAALMLQQDATLTAAELKQIIVQSGSTSRGIGALPLLDAFEALQHVARRPNTPLCGNRIWADSANGLWSQRGAGSEPLVTVGTSEFDATYANVHHGGRRIEMSFGIRYVLSAGTWSEDSWEHDSISNYSGSFKGSGAWFQDHDDRFSTYITGVRQVASVAFEVSKVTFAFDTIPQHTQVIQALASAPALLTSQTSSCVWEEADSTTGIYECKGSASEGTIDIPTQWSSASAGSYSNSNVLHALDPQGRFAVVLVGIRRHTSSISPTWGPCSGKEAKYPSVRCRPFTANNQVSLRTELYHVDLATGAATLLSVAASALADGVAGDEVFWLSIDERGEEIAVQVGGISLGTSGFNCTNGRHQWLRFGATAQSVLMGSHAIPVPGRSICEGVLDGSGTSALRAVDR